MDFIMFSLIFTLAHSISYTIAGAISLKFSKDIYETKDRLCTFLRDMSVKEESLHVQKYFLLGQLLRGLLMSIVLFPILNSLMSLSFFVRFIFFFGLTFIYTHLSSASPFMDNIEGFIYFKREYISKKFFLKFQLEMTLYSIMFGVFTSSAIDFFII